MIAVKPKLTTIANQPSWVVASDRVKLAVTALGGHMAPVTFRLAGGRKAQPYFISPWQNEGQKITEPVLVPLRGDFFCMPFGGGSYRGPYAKGEGKLYVYDVQSNTWTNLPDKGALPFWFGSNVCCMHYDSVNDRVVCFTHSPERKLSLVNVFDPNTGAWDAEPLAVPAGVPAEQCWHGFYCPQVNAHFIYTAHDSSDQGTMWAYRYRKAVGP